MSIIAYLLYMNSGLFEIKDSQDYIGASFSRTIAKMVFLMRTRLQLSFVFIEIAVRPVYQALKKAAKR